MPDLDHRALERCLSAEQVGAYGLVAELMEHSCEDRLVRVRTDPHHHTPSFILLAIALCRETDRDFDDRFSWGQLAVAAAEEAEDLRATELLPLAVAVLGNHYRCAGNLFEAGASFERCRLLHSRLADPLEMVECLSLEASYLRVVRRFSAAEECLAQAAEIAESFGSAPFRAKLDVQLGSIYADSEDWSQAMFHLRRGLLAAQKLSDSPLALIAGHNLAGVFVEIGDYDWAAANLVTMEPFYERFGSSYQRTMRDWLFARIALGRSAYPEAVARLEKVRDAFLAARDPYHAALVRLDLAEALVALGDWKDAETTASAAAEALSSCGSATEALAAVAYLVEGIRDRLAVSVVRELAARVRRNAPRRF